MFESVSKTEKSLKVNGILKWVRKLEINWDMDKKMSRILSVSDYNNNIIVTKILIKFISSREGSWTSFESLLGQTLERLVHSCIICLQLLKYGTAET